MMKNMFAKGFTLTELMAVVIIIAILAGIGLGSYRKAVERSHFTEGLVDGNAILEAVNRYYYDNPDLSDSERKRPKVDYLDIGLSNARSCTINPNKDYCLRTKYFEIVVQSWGVQVNRVQNNAVKDYYFYLYPDFATGHYPDQCISRSATGHDLCVTMGYTNCSGSGSYYSCTK